MSSSPSTEEVAEILVAAAEMSLSRNAKTRALGKKILRLIRECGW